VLKNKKNKILKIRIVHNRKLFRCDVRIEDGHRQDDSIDVCPHMHITVGSKAILHCRIKMVESGLKHELNVANVCT